MHTSVYLIEAGKVIKDEAYWCQGALARDKHGKEVKPRTRTAVKWDANGIIFKVCRVNPDDYESNQINLAAECGNTLDMCALIRFQKGITTVNDQLGHAAVMDCLRDAVRRSRGRELEDSELSKDSRYGARKR